MSISDRIIAHFSRRAPDIQIGGSDNPYMNRWYVIPRNPLFNIYLHQFIRDDEDRALHDHPWASLSWMLKGSLYEHSTLFGRPICQGAWTFREARFTHRLEVPNAARGKTWTLFITGPRVREWGFHCPKGFVPWRDFTAGAQGETVGRGCGE